MLGLTGSIGAGKSTAANLLRKHGLTVLDADAAAHALSRTPEVQTEVARQLGPQYVTADGFDRAALAALVFADPAKRDVLNAIVHPRVRALLGQQTAEAAARGEAWVVQDVPLLFEGEGWRQMNATLLIDAPLELRISRVMKRSGLDRETVLARDAAQMPAEQKRRLATVVVDNSGDEAQLEAGLVEALRSLGIGEPGSREDGRS
ncbi:dephospho-CoA kinase [Deinococcus sp. KNUC1210]|uniref:dephospho-CoA kinase n=1 Tax=Deinococcus sp. KNUC1210 TaxID=2917691 RepID=UPI001EEF9062|nr:dephospho-CoA kinase [Deinococcus sp. KNUC1210]ULH15802.1 dephospho-CoA kinase [Deinococcus sp. KNUC1210]